MTILGLKKRIIGLAEHPKAIHYLCLISFIDASFFPISPMTLLLPMFIYNQHKPEYLIWLASIASLFGALSAYGIGYWAKPTITELIIYFDFEAPFLAACDWMQSRNFWTMISISFAPIPFKVFTLSAGIMQLNLPKFMLASFLSRGLKFYLLFLLTRYRFVLWQVLVRCWQNLKTLARKF